MIVLDASAAVELVLWTARAEAIAERVLNPAEQLHAPHLIDVEVVQTLRRLVLARKLPSSRADEALEDFGLLAFERHAHRPMLDRVWAFRASLSAYDAVYVALAEGLDAPLLTCDEKLARSHGHMADIQLVDTR